MLEKISRVLGKSRGRNFLENNGKKLLGILGKREEDYTKHMERILKRYGDWRSIEEEDKELIKELELIGVMETRGFGGKEEARVKEEYKEILPQKISHFLENIGKWVLNG